MNTIQIFFAINCFVNIFFFVVAKCCFFKLKSYKFGELVIRLIYKKYFFLSGGLARLLMSKVYKAALMLPFFCVPKSIPKTPLLIHSSLSSPHLPPH